MFGQFGWGEMLLLIVVGLFVFGPERLPTIARDAGKVIRQFRDTAKSMRDDLQAELGPELAELDLKSLNPRTLVEKHLLGDDDEDEQSASAAQPVVASEIPLPPPRTDLTKPARPDATPYDDDAT
ncbi:MAG TPA: sec-independent translocase [Frankiaceae bacterium]|nr:sec-independent translocase [Frankiaceae bacterium]